MARVREVHGTRRIALDRWELVGVATGSVAAPDALESQALGWCPATAPGTVASSLRAAGRWTLDDRMDFDASDWWYRSRFTVSRASSDAACALRFGGLASLADVWLNGEPVLTSDNMFHEHDVDVGHCLRADNDLLVRFRSVSSQLQVRRPRPRWRTRLVQAQQLRWIRTTLLGRIPAWTPPAAPVGPWRAIALELRTRLVVRRADIRPRIEGDDGGVDVHVLLSPLDGSTARCAALHVGEHTTKLACTVAPDGAITVQGAARVPNAERWWPHTHGAPTRYAASLDVETTSGVVRLDLGFVGFRTVDVDRTDDGFALRINGASIFCRGACWTPLDPIGLAASPNAVRAALDTVRRAGMNMVRVPGPFFYEDDAFFDACDELGILVWHDYPFANMDYPGEDAPFVASVKREAADFLDRTQLACSLTVLCGNSEVEQQAAMMGAEGTIWRSPLFSDVLATASGGLRPDVVYWPSTPSGGALPFFTDVGTAHYFGVGAYLRPLDDARRANVRFTTECLAFANVPEPRTIDDLMKDRAATQDPVWKGRVPRDSGVGWDFDDVRDHYLRVLFHVDPVTLRYSDVHRYLALSRVVPGEVMAATFAEWRRVASTCRGALVWLLRDLWPGAGWGIVDADGTPKATYHYLRRALAPLAVLLVDEGLNGVDAHVLNDGPESFRGELRVMLLRDGNVVVRKATVSVAIAPRSAAQFRLAEVLGQFLDLTYAYRFGPPAHDITVVTLVESATGETRSESVMFVQGMLSRQESDVGLEVEVVAGVEGTFTVSLRARRFAQSVALDVPGFEADDNYMHIVPGSPRHVMLTPMAGTTRLNGTAQALNATVATKITPTSRWAT